MAVRLAFFPLEGKSTGINDGKSKSRLGSKEKVHEFPNKESSLKDGDLVSFGTGNARNVRTDLSEYFIDTMMQGFVFYGLACSSLQLQCYLGEFLLLQGCEGNWDELDVSNEAGGVGVALCVEGWLEKLQRDFLWSDIGKGDYNHYLDWGMAFAGKNIGTEIPSCSS
ncbi:hypothetical protein RHGRI_030522 [Rhododendron griersonianum]|uniref:Uncharacterized protein n=1 Tax=Rhododendron griersonianum TaxID=479676 RepID=A0AAV6ITJ8_9ERIC|nr:hypothetical protein RHGRI_030522 [Rhododendron griersonianum]